MREREIEMDADRESARDRAKERQKKERERERETGIQRDKKNKIEKEREIRREDSHHLRLMAFPVLITTHYLSPWRRNLAVPMATGNLRGTQRNWLEYIKEACCRFQG